nr:retrovirus-related Pol polyprotein from transposon TNT 1-94 [Tanacetum cinerariifolium]
MLVQNQAPEGEGSAIPPEPQPTPSTSHPTALVPQIADPQTTKRKTQKRRRTQKDTELPQTSVLLKLRADEAVHQKEGDSGMDTSGGLRRQETIGGTSAQTRFERVLKQPNEPPLTKGHTSGSGEGRMEHIVELRDTVPPTPYDSPLTRGYIPRSDEGLHHSHQTSEEVRDTSQQKRSRAVIHSSNEEEPSMDIEDSPKQGRMIKELDQDEDVNLVTKQGEVKETTESLRDDDYATLAETLLNIKRSAEKDKGKGIMQETKLPKKLKKRKMIQLSIDEELAQKLYAEELAKKAARQEQEKFNLEKALELQRQLDQRKEDVDKGGYKQSYFKEMKYEDIRPIFERVWDQVHTFIPKDSGIEKEVMKRVGFDLQQESSKKQKLDQQTKETGEEVEAQVDSDQEVEEMKLYMRIIPDEDIAIEAIPLATKPPVIVEYKIIKEGKISNYHITRADGSTKRYTLMINLLENIDREDLETLWKLVKDKHGNTRPEEGYERVLWGDLKVMFEPDIKSKISAVSEDRRKQTKSLVLLVIVVSTAESLNVTFDESAPPTKLSPLVDDDVGEEEAIRKNTKIINTNNEEDESIEVDEIVNIKESKNHPLDQVMGNLNQRTLRYQAQNHISRNKARLVVQGYNQQEGIDYDETYALVARLESIKILLAIACANDFKLYQMDVKIAFLNGFINEEVYVAQPPGFIDFQKPNYVYKLKKDLYGLRQAPKAWYDRLKAFLTKHEYSIGIVDNTLFTKKSKSHLIIVQIYVEDIIFGSTSQNLCDDIAKIMHDEFEMSMIGEFNFFLGLQIKQIEDGIFFNQYKYVKEMLKKFELEDSKPTRMPMSMEIKLTKDDEADSVDNSKYQGTKMPSEYQQDYKKTCFYALKIYNDPNMSDSLKDTNRALEIRYVYGGRTIDPCFYNDLSDDLVAKFTAIGSDCLLSLDEQICRRRTVHEKIDKVGNTIDKLPNQIETNELFDNLRPCELVIRENVYSTIANRDHTQAVIALMLYSLENRQPFNLAYFIVRRMYFFKDRRDKVLPYGMILTRLFKNLKANMA